MLTTRLPKDTSVGAKGTVPAANILSSQSQPELPYQQRVTIANKDKTKSTTIFHTIKPSPPASEGPSPGTPVVAPAAHGAALENSSKEGSGKMVATTPSARISNSGAPAAGGSAGSASNVAAAAAAAAAAASKKKKKNKRGSQSVHADDDGINEGGHGTSDTVASSVPAVAKSSQPPASAPRVSSPSPSNHSHSHHGSAASHHHHNHSHTTHSHSHSHRTSSSTQPQHTCNNPAHAHYRPPTPHRVASPLPLRANSTHSHRHQHQNDFQSESEEEYIVNGAAGAQSTGSAKKKKSKKKKKSGDASQQQDGNSNNRPAGDVWYKSDAEEKQRIREFWLHLGEDERRGLVKLEKEAVLRKMKEQQKQTCSCAVCGRKRTVIEEELEILYDAYYEELENFANDHTRNQTSASVIVPRSHLHHPAAQHMHRSAPAPSSAYLESDDDEEGDEEDDEDEEGHSGGGSMFEFGSSLTVKEGGILTVADDFLKNDGRKFLDLMEQLAERKIRMLEEEDSANGNPNGQDWDDGYDDEEDDEYDDEEDSMTEEQRMEEGRRMFQIFAAKMFEQRVLTAYREKVAQERQMRLLQELEEEERQKELQEEAKQKNKEKKKEKKKAVKQQKEEEKLAKEREKAAEEERLREEREKKNEKERQKREQERLKKEEERLKKEEADRAKREQERLKKEEEKRKQKEAEERKQKLREEKEKEKKEKEARVREAAERDAAAKRYAELEAERKLQEEKLAAERAQAILLAQQYVKQHHSSPTENASPATATTSPISQQQQQEQPLAAKPPMVRPPPSHAQPQPPIVAVQQQQQIQQSQQRPASAAQTVGIPLPSFSNVQHMPAHIGRPIAPRPLQAPTQQTPQNNGAGYIQQAPPGIPARIPSNNPLSSPPQTLPNQLQQPYGVAPPPMRPLMQQHQASAISPTKSMSDLAVPHMQQPQQFGQLHHLTQTSHTGPVETHAQLPQQPELVESSVQPPQMYGLNGMGGVGMGWGGPTDPLQHQLEQQRQRQMFQQQQPLPAQSLASQQQVQQQSYLPPSVTALPGLLMEQMQQQQQPQQRTAPLPIGTGSKAVGSRPGPGPIGRPTVGSSNAVGGPSILAGSSVGKASPFGAPDMYNFFGNPASNANPLDDYGVVPPVDHRFKDWLSTKDQPMPQSQAPGPVGRNAGAVGQIPMYMGNDGGVGVGVRGAFDWEQPSTVGGYSAFGPVASAFNTATHPVGGLQHSLFPPAAGGKSASPQVAAGKPTPVGGQRTNGVIGQGPSAPIGSSQGNNGAFDGTSQSGRGGWNGYGF